MIMFSDKNDKNTISTLIIDLNNNTINNLTFKILYHYKTSSLLYY